MEDCCGRCRFWRNWTVTTEPRVGECWRFPPRLPDEVGEHVMNTRRVPTDEGEWCGEFVPRSLT